MNALLRLIRLAALAVTGLVGIATFAPTQAQAGHERGWVGGQGADFHYRPARQVWREQRLHQRHYAPVYYAPAYHAPIYRQPGPVYYQPYPAYGYQQHCEVKKRWRGLHKVKKVVCY